MDTAYCLEIIKPEQFVRIVRNHGADRVLFATDSPWGGQKETVEYLARMDFTKEELERMFWRNGAQLLGLE